MVALIQWNLDVAKGQRTGKNLFPITRIRYIEVLFHIFHYCWPGVNKIVRYTQDLYYSLVHGFHYNNTSF